MPISLAVKINSLVDFVFITASCLTAKLTKANKMLVRKSRGIAAQISKNRSKDRRFEERGTSADSLLKITGALHL